MPGITSDNATKSEQTSSIALVFGQLAGTWVLNRILNSNNAAEPSGKCIGTATFKPREPSVFIGDDSKLDLAQAEIVYHEQGEFEMYQTVGTQNTAPKFPFSRKYIWRLQEHPERSSHVLSIWFTKPGTEQIDYLFHKVDMQTTDLEAEYKSQSTCNLEGEGGHLCEEDFYSSSYTFHLSKIDGDGTSSVDSSRLTSWKMLHEVRGPQKDQAIATEFTRP